MQELGDHFRRHVGLLIISLAIQVGALCVNATRASAVGDSATKFNLYVPPNNSHTSRASTLIVTNISPTTATVDIIDDNADGDEDDTVRGVSLAQAESYIVVLADGAINDDLGGKKDGDYFKVRSDHPVVVQMATRSNWQHDWAPSDGKGAAGRSFFLYAPPTSGADNDINVYAYEDNTRVTVRDITTRATTQTGKTSVDLDSGVLVLDTILDQGEDLIVRENNLGLDILKPGRTYHVQSTHKVTVQYGHLGQVRGGNQARDGAGFVPSVNGSSSGELYFFSIPHNPGRQSEKELRVVCYDNSTTVDLYGANGNDPDWTHLRTSEVSALGHVDYVGGDDAAFRNHALYKLTVSPPYHKCTVFEGNWMETGSFGTSDFASAVSGASGRNLDHTFVAYVGPPGKQENVKYPTSENTNIPYPARGFASHLYVYAQRDNTGVTVVDVDTGGSLFSHTFLIDSDEYFDVVIDRATYQSITANGHRPYFSVRSSAPVMVMNGNFNDNWLAFFHSVIEPEPRVDLHIGGDEISCGQSTRVHVSCSNGSGPTLDDVKITLTLPKGMRFNSESSTLPATTSSMDSDLRETTIWNQDKLAPGEKVEVEFDASLDCSELSCVPPDLSAVTVECEGGAIGETYADVRSENIMLTGNDHATVVGFSVTDNPGYDDEGEPPYVEVRFAIEGASAGTTIALLRASDDPDADATHTVLLEQSLGSNALSSYVIKDNYTLHYEETRFYRLVVTDAGCQNVDGPVAVRTSSGSSGGEDSGLESNGRLSSQLAQRQVSRRYNITRLPDGIEDLSEKRLWPRVSYLGSRSRQLSQLAPTEGPAKTAALNVTPSDLPALTNAADVFSTDYVSTQGERIASLLLFETWGEQYEHAKSLCDRASGSRLLHVDSGQVQQGELLRAVYDHPRDKTGEYAVEFKLYENSDGSFDVFSAWLDSDYPAPRDDQRVIGVQAWSSKPGYELTLAEDLLANVDVSTRRLDDSPKTYFRQASKIGNTIQAKLASRSTDVNFEQMNVRVTRLIEGGNVITEQVPVDHEGSINLERPGSLDATMELLDETEETVDRVWMSDGAWTSVHDGMWGGQTTLNNADFSSCHIETTDSEQALSLSGCGSISASVDRFAGVARHFGGAHAPLDLAKYRSMSFWIRSDAPVHICHELRSHHPVCTEIMAQPGGATLSIPLDIFQTEDSCEHLALEDIDMVTFTTRTSGPANLEVSTLRYHPYRNVLDSGALPPANCTTPTIEQAHGCSVHERSAHSSHTFMIALLGLVMFVGVRRRTQP